MPTGLTRQVQRFALVASVLGLICVGCEREETAPSASPAIENTAIAEVEHATDDSGVGDVADVDDVADAVEAPQTPQAPLAEPGPLEKMKVTAILAQADALDGKTDKVVSKCLMCACRMDGSPEHAVTYAGYSLHLCSEDCRKFFVEDPLKAVTNLSLEGMMPTNGAADEG